VGYENAIIASMKSDLVELVAAQDAFYLTNSDYAGSSGTSETPGTGGAGVAIFTPSRGNVLVLTYRDASSWTATVTYYYLAPGTTTVCGIYQGPPSASPNAAVTSHRTPACW
jgi:hypothetical protein